MDERRKKEIDSAWRKARRAQLVEDLRRMNKAWFVIAVFLVAVLVAFIAFPAFAPPHLIKTVEARGLSEASYASKYFPGRRDALAQLDDGTRVTFIFPRSGVFRPGVPMKLDLYERSWGPIHVEWYRFHGYVEIRPEAASGPRPLAKDPPHP